MSLDLCFTAASTFNGFTFIKLLLVNNFGVCKNNGFMHKQRGTIRSEKGRIRSHAYFRYNCIAFSVFYELYCAILTHAYLGI